MKQLQFLFALILLPLSGFSQIYSVGNGDGFAFGCVGLTGAEVPLPIQLLYFDARCNIGSFVLVRVAKRQDPEFAPNRGPRMEGQAAALQAKAVPGDKFLFQEIKCKCPGDPAERNLGQLVFDIQ